MDQREKGNCDDCDWTATSLETFVKIIFVTSISGLFQMESFIILCSKLHNLEFDVFGFLYGIERKSTSLENITQTKPIKEPLTKNLAGLHGEVLSRKQLLC
jgi:hypothetical protein